MYLVTSIAFRLDIKRHSLRFILKGSFNVNDSKKLASISALVIDIDLVNEVLTMVYNEWQ
jgi:hypothetical protein